MNKEKLISPKNIELMFILMDAIYQNALKKKMNLPSNMEKMFNESPHALYKQVHEKAVNKIFSEKGIFHNSQWPGSVLPTLKDFGNLKNKQDGGNKRRRSKKSNRLLKKSRKRSKKIQRGAGGEWIAAMVLFPFIIFFHIGIDMCWNMIPLQRDSYTADPYSNSTTYDHDEPVVGHEP